MYMYINKLGSRSYGYIHLKSSHICVIHLVLERCCFEAVLPKKRLRPLGVNASQLAPGLRTPQFMVTTEIELSVHSLKVGGLNLC